MQKKSEGLVFHDEDFDYLPEEFQFLFFQFFKAYSRERAKPDFDRIPDQTDLGEANRLLKAVLKAYWQKMEDRAVGEKEAYLQRKTAREKYKGKKKNENIEENGNTEISAKNEDIPEKRENSRKTQKKMSSVFVSDSDSVFESEFGSESVFGSDSEFDSDCESVSEETLHNPTLEEISEYIDSNDLGIDAERFFDTYEKSGWKINGKPFDWKKQASYWAKTQIVKVKSASGGDVPDQWALTAENARKRRAKKNE